MEMEKRTFREVSFRAVNGWPVLVGLLAFLAALFTLTVNVAATVHWVYWFFAVPATLAALISLTGFFLVNPNMARVLVLFGRYRGTVRKDGFYWTNPFTVKHLVSLRTHNLASETVKVNDMLGNPIEIGAVVVWQVRDTALASFNVEDYQQYVDVQIETAVRELAKAHPYDEGQAEEDVLTLRGDTESTSKELTAELQERLNRAGIEVIEARISHLAYASEIASAMLQRQQAVAIIAARQKIVEGAVSMVEQALEDLSARKVVALDDAQRAALVGNLLVVLCGQSAPQPVLNTGGLGG